MSFTPNEKQREVIAHRDGSLLVAAAAGSGKTATLIVHVLDRLKESDPRKRGDLRRMIIVTFTNAAASEMRAKLIRELNLAVEESPDPAWLRLQAEIAQQAHICTVDSLCGFLVRNYFDKADLSPDVRIAEKAELSLLKQDILDALMEEKYREGDDADFFDLISCYSSEKNDDAVRKLVISLYDTAQNAVFPDDWLIRAAQPQPEDEEAFWQQEWVKALETRVREQLAGAEDGIDACIRRTERSDVPLREDFLVMLQSDRSYFESLLREDFPGILRRIGEDPGWMRKPSVSGKKNSAEEIELNAVISAEREDYKELVKKRLAPDFGKSPERHFALVRMTEAPKKALIALVREFSRRLKEEMKNRNIADFIDIEHHALDLLIRKTEEGIERTELARQLAADFDEIIIDEYQDINNVQDELLHALSREDDGAPNLFLVGDVKQSIYRFRRANPGIFLEKYKSYAADGSGLHKKIDLSVNYRSRGEILEGINDLFRRVMDEALGGIVYDENAQLNCGADYPGSGHVPELLLTEGNEKLQQENRVREAQRIGRKIRELLANGRLRDDKSPDGFRKVSLKDIRILLRGLGNVRSYVDTLNDMGIPAAAPMKHGFYDTQEVQTVLALLKIIDNPRQDIPLAAVLTSPLGGAGDSLLADAAGFARDLTDPSAVLYDRLLAAWEGDPVRFARIGAFLEKLENWRDLAEILSIPELIHTLMTETGYEYYLRAMPGGMARLANLELLLDKAEAFETTSYRGLYQFNRYIERARSSTDEGEAPAAGDEEDVVHIDTIHSSKGLQYPVVFLAGASAGFNMDDTKGAMLIHETEGIALQSRDRETRQQLKNLKQIAAADRITLETKAEELRLLYVALTRAEEYLYISGWVKDPHRWKDAWPSCEDAAPGALPAHLVRQADSYMDWILMAAAAGCPHLKISPETAAEAGEDAVRRAHAALGWEQLRQRMESVRKDPPDISEKLDKRVNFCYPYEALAGVRGIYTVSALKTAAQEESAGLQEDGPAAELPAVKRESESRAAGAEKGRKGSLSGAERGTVYHKIMEHLVIAKLKDEASAAEEIARMKDKGLLSDEEAAAVPPAEILAFFETPLGERVREADAEGRLFREQPFILGVPLSEVDASFEGSREQVLIQGIIDLYFEEDGKLILIDYKTDRVAHIHELEACYRTQLNYYRRALEQATGKPVAETLIYSTVLQKFHRILIAEN